MSLETQMITDVKKKSIEIKSDAESLVVESKEDLLKANEYLVIVKRQLKLMVLEKEKITRPANEALKAARDLFRPIESSLSEAKRTIEGKMLSAKRALDEEARKERERIEADKRIKRVDTTMKKVAEIETVDNQMFAQQGSSSFSERKVVVIEDFGKIPKEYFRRERVVEALMIELRKDATGNKSQGIEPIEIPGTKIETVTGISTNF